MKERVFDEKKFVNAVLFFAKNTNPSQLGSTKLNKLLFYSDFLHFKRYGRPITGDRYLKMEHGPVPSTAYAIIVGASKKLTETPSKTKILEGKIIIHEDRVQDKKISRIEALVQPDMTVFSDSEIEILSEVADRLKNLTGTKLSKFSHLPNSPWSKTDNLQTIDYELSLDKTGDSLSKSYIEQWKKEKSDLAEILAA